MIQAFGGKESNPIQPQGGEPTELDKTKCWLPFSSYDPFWTQRAGFVEPPSNYFQDQYYIGELEGAREGYRQMTP